MRATEFHQEPHRFPFLLDVLHCEGFFEMQVRRMDGLDDI